MPTDPTTPRQVADRLRRRAGRARPDRRDRTSASPRARTAGPTAPRPGSTSRAHLRRRRCARSTRPRRPPAAATGSRTSSVAARGCSASGSRRSSRSRTPGSRCAQLDTMSSPPQSMRQAFTLMPTGPGGGLGGIARPSGAGAGGARQQYRATLETGRDRGLVAGRRQVEAVVEQVGGAGRRLVRLVRRARSRGAPRAPDPRRRGRRRRDRRPADLARRRVRPAAVSAPDAAGRDRYRLSARAWAGADLDLDEAYAWGWAEFARIDAEIRAEAQKVLPGATPAEAMRAPGRARPRDRRRRRGARAPAAPHGRGDRGARRRPLRPRRAGAPGRVDDRPCRRRRRAVLHAPAQDFSGPAAPGCPTMGRDRFPLWDLVSTWYHEGVPGHHLQLAQWVYVAAAALALPDRRRRRSAPTSRAGRSTPSASWTSSGSSPTPARGSVTSTPAHAGRPGDHRHRHAPRAGDPATRASRAVPPRRALDAGARPRVLRRATAAGPPAFLDSEIDPLPRLARARPSATSSASAPGSPAGRGAAGARGPRRDFDLKAWHMAALSQGSLGLDDLVSELSAL